MITTTTSVATPRIPLTIRTPTFSSLPTTITDLTTASLPSTTTVDASIYVVASSAAKLTLKGTTVTAYALPEESALEAEVDGTTLSFRGSGITVAHGQVVSLGYDELVDSTTSAAFKALATPTTLTALSRPTLPGTLRSISSASSVAATALTTSTSTSGSSKTETTISGLKSITTDTTSSSASSSSSAAAASTSSTSTSSAAAAAGPTNVLRGAGSGLALLGLLGGVAAYAL